MKRNVPEYMDASEKKLYLEEGTIGGLTGAALGVDPETKRYCCPKEKLSLNGHKAICGMPGLTLAGTVVSNEIYDAVRKGESFILNAPRVGEYEVIKNICERRGYHTRIFNLRNACTSDNMYFMQMLRDEGGDADEELRLVQAFAKALLENAKLIYMDDYLEEQQLALLTAIILYVLNDKRQNKGPFFERVFCMAADLDVNHKYGEKIFGAIPEKHPAKRFYNLYASSEERLQKDVCNKLFNKLQIAMPDDIGEAIMDDGKEGHPEDGIDLLMPLREKCAYFVVPPKEIDGWDWESAGGIVAAFYTLFFMKAERHISLASGEPVIRTHVLLDDFPKAGYIPQFDNLLKAAGKELPVTITFRNYDELQDIYGTRQRKIIKMSQTTSWESIIECFDMNIYLGNRELDSTIDYYQKLLMGDKKEKRYRMAEIFGLKPGEGIAFLKGLKPFKIEPYCLYNFQALLLEPTND